MKSAIRHRPFCTSSCGDSFLAPDTFSLTSRVKGAKRSIITIDRLQKKDAQYHHGGFGELYQWIFFMLRSTT
jgi:hypothetical protein